MDVESVSCHESPFFDFLEEGVQGKVCGDKVPA
jgi:hypothetical protein